MQNTGIFKTLSNPTMTRGIGTFKYYAFGSAINEMQYKSDTGGGYRYGFNNKETDLETDLQDYGFRIYNPDICKFLSVDPLESNYPMLTPFQFASNTPIIAADLDGLEAFVDMLPNPYNTILILNTGREIAQSTVNGIVMLVTRLPSAFVNGITFGYGDKVYGNGSYTCADWGYYRFSFDNGIYKNGFSYDNDISLSGTSVTFDDGMAMLDGLTSISPFIIAKGLTTIPKVITGSNGVKIANYFAKQYLELTSKGISIYAGNVINLSASKTTTILGKIDDIKKIRATGVHVKNNANTGGISILSRNAEWTALETKHTNILDGKKGIDYNKVADDFWELYNKPFLDDAIKRGDNIRLVSDPNDLKNLYVDGEINKGLSMFGREVQYLKDNNYKFADGYAIKITN